MIKLEQKEFDMMNKSWNFSNLHLRYDWEDLIDVPSIVISSLKQYIEDFTLNKDKIFERLKQGIPPGLLLYSNATGTAKTALIHIIAKELLKGRKGIVRMKYLQSVEMFSEIKRQFNPQGGLNDSDIITDIFKSDVFFLDDFDKLIRWSAWEKEQGIFIIDSCYTDMRPIIMTGNSSLAEMKSRHGLEQALYSRLLQMCTEVRIEIEDYREKEKKGKKNSMQRKFV